MASSSVLSFLQDEFLLGYEQLLAAYCGGMEGFLVILRCSRTSGATAAAVTPQLLYRITEPTTFPGLAALLAVNHK